MMRVELALDGDGFSGGMRRAAEVVKRLSWSFQPRHRLDLPDRDADGPQTWPGDQA